MTVKSSSAGKDLRHVFLPFWDSGRAFLEANDFLPARCLAAAPKGPAGHTGLVLRVQSQGALEGPEMPYYAACAHPKPKDLVACGMPFSLLICWKLSNTGKVE